MKTIHLQAVIEGIRSKKDRSLGLSISTPELSVQERAIFMEIQGVNVDLLITPLDTTEIPEKTNIDKDLNTKSQSSRIRSILYILFQQYNEGMSFEDYYRNKTEKYIEMLKGKIEN